jgi:integrase
LVANHNVRLANKQRRQRNKRGDGARPMMPTKDELKAIITHTPDEHRPLILTALFAGLRGSELRGLAWPNVDLRRGRINVVQRADRYNRIGPTKSKAGTRTIPMAPLLLNALKAWKLKCPVGELGLVFPNGAGNVENHSNLLWRVFWPIQIAAGVTVISNDRVPDAKYSLHALRHAAAALWIEQGFGPKRIQELMGHSTIATTFDLYGYLFDQGEADTAAMAQVAARLLD